MYRQFNPRILPEGSARVARNPLIHAMPKTVWHNVRAIAPGMLSYTQEIQTGVRSGGER